MIFYLFAQENILSQSQASTEDRTIQAPKASGQSNSTKPDEKLAQTGVGEPLQPLRSEERKTEEKPSNSSTQSSNSSGTSSNSGSNQSTSQSSGTSEAAKEKVPGAPYKSPWKGNIEGELLNNLLLTPEHQSSVRKNTSFWLNDNIRVGFQVRPRFESFTNRDFDKSTSDSQNYVTQNSQFWALVDVSESFAGKVTIQDTRLWGQYKDPAGSGYGPTTLTNSIGTTYDTTKSPDNQVPVKNNTDIREAYFIWKDFLPYTKLYAGRQSFSLGDSRIIGARNDGQIGNSFDILRAVFDTKTWQTQAGYGILAEESAPNGFNTANNQKAGGPNALNDTYIAFLYNTWKPSSDLVVDLYEVGIAKKYNTTTSKTVDPNTRTNGRDNLFTTGFRLSNRTASGRSLPEGKSWDWALEAAFQTGSTGQQINATWDPLHLTTGAGAKKQAVYKETVQHDASFFLIQSGYTYKGFRVGAQFARASGDPNRTDGTAGTWDPMFGTRSGGFPYFDSGNGITNASFWSNVKTTSVHVSWVHEVLGRFIFAAYDVRKDKTQDAWYDGNRVAVLGSTGYDANGNFVTGNGTSVGGSTENLANNPFLKNWKPGHRLLLEYDLIYIKKINDSFSLWITTSLLKAGDAIKNQKQYNFEKESTHLSVTLQFAI
ncbi:alginate export family protein [Leptospira perolatii]|uniref:alginate export family protein n=1 Tax=Leptospira perolatii TaxID=2023191 RepID=UPI001FAF7D9F|nr:alginate export family protein [Leptospira perolatii]